MVDLTALPPELIAHVLSLLFSPEDLARADCTGRLFHGFKHSAALSRDGVVLTWGGGAITPEDELEECLAMGDHALQPARVCAPALDGERVVCASAGFNFSLVVTQSGRALAFGDDGARSTDKHGCGRLGLGRLPHARPLPEGATEGETRVHTPTELRLWATAAGRTERVRAAGASAGRWFSIVLAANGHAYSFGHGENGKLGHGDEAARCVPTRVEALVGSGAGDAVVHASAGGDHAIFVRADGRAYGCGFNRRGQLGQGDDADDVLTPRQLRGLDGERALSASAGLGHSLVATASGALFSFGNGKSGKLGHGDEESQRLPKRIAALQLAGAQAWT